MSESIKPRIDFEQPLSPSHALELRAGITFDPDQAERFYPTAPELQQEEEHAEVIIIMAVLKPRRSLWRTMVTVGLVLFTASLVAQSVQWLHTAWGQQDWIAIGGSVAGGLILFAGIGWLITEWYRLYRLRQRAQERDLARELLHSHGLGKGRAFCETLARQAGLEQGQPVLDNQARREISHSAAELTLMIAISLLALVDMAFIAWRNIRLINRIAALYGIELGYFSRIRLFRLVLLNIAFAGASELVREVGMDWMSQDLPARLSARAAQGIGAGLLTARLGINAVELCRPLPWLEGEKPKLGDFRSELIGQLKDRLKKRDGKAK
ncbi:YcjF family protein [Serratia symbiotica]|uniref:YcjF family protein n=1 Tax=Serratia symbiotica TaxID=138074 RepID=UPI001DC228BA|nr:TIGR01620 family protein [Serratia symbiotica]NIG88307.1 TIGR01620 family protein [Serratia symbiotica]USS94839.1 YcjF family protein [Serratia symbiotica]